MTKTLLARFEEKYAVNPITCCWEWIANKNNKGYGMLRPGGTENKRLAHRISYELYKSSVPKGMHVLHHCDNPSCVNPDHLFLGTHADNMRDKESKNRANHADMMGEENASAILNDAKVVEIRNLYSGGESRQSLSARFGVTYGCIADIISNRSWRHLPESKKRKADQNNAKLKPSDIPVIRKMFSDGLNNHQIANKYGVSHTTICDIRRGATWR